jgi:hypothetical protein
MFEKSDQPNSSEANLSMIGRLKNTSLNSNVHQIKSLQDYRNKFYGLSNREMKPENKMVYKIKYLYIST